MRKIWILCAVLALVFTAACGQQAVPAPNSPETEPPAVLPSSGEEPSGEGAVETAPETPVDAGPCTFVLPEGWVWETLADDSQGWAAAFYPQAQEGRVVLRHFDGGFGVCGTGLKTRELTLDGGNTASVGYYDGRDAWDYVSFGGDWAALNEGAGDWSEAALKVLRTLCFTEEAGPCPSEQP